MWGVFKSQNLFTVKPGDGENLLTVFAFAEASKFYRKPRGRHQARMGSTEGLAVVHISNLPRFRGISHPTRELLQAGIRSKRLEVLEKDEEQGVEAVQEYLRKHPQNTHPESMHPDRPWPLPLAGQALIRP